MTVHSLGYVRVGSPRVDEWRAFGRDVLGLMPVDGPVAEAAHFRVDHYPPRLVVGPAGAPGLEAVGFEVRDKRALRRVVADVEAAGIEVREGTPDECARRRVTGFAAFTDPGGAPVELFYGPVLDHVPLTTPHGTRFVTGTGGMGHLVYGSPTARAAADFYIDVLGFAERNTMSTPLGDMWFLSPNDRHHTLGVLDAQMPFQLFHICFETATIDDLGLALDRIAKHGAHLMQSLGRHTNDHMISFYVYTPDLNAVELGWGGPPIGPDEPTYAITKGEFWGHQFFPPPAAKERAQ